MLQDDKSYNYVLAYKFDVFSAEPFARSNIYVNATNGEVVLSDAIIKHADKAAKLTSSYLLKNHPETVKQTSNFVPGNAQTRYSGTQTIETILTNGSYVLRDNTRGNGVITLDNRNNNYNNLGSAIDFKDADNNWTTQEYNNSRYDNAALDAHWGVGRTYDYFKNKFNRNSYNNQGAVLRNYVHVGSNWENAAWTGSEMVYGDGASRFSPLTALDVTAHELGHAVCGSTASLVYERESGALNEALSDIWGAAVEFYAAPNKQAFLIGEDISKGSPNFLRSMSNPKAGGQPDTYRGTNWKAATSGEGCWFPGSSTNDYCGVHTNNGVLNHWFYVLTMGKSGTNDLGKSYNVTGIGIEKAEKIVYRLETAYLTANSTYVNAKDYGIQSAIDLFGANSAEHVATQNAFYAVGLGTQIVQTDVTAPTAPTNLAANSTTQTSTNLTWTASTDNIGVVGYDIYRDNTLIGSSATLSYNVSGLASSTTYTFFVKAKDSAGNVSQSSNTLSVSTLAPIPDNSAPTVPTNLAALNVSQTSLRLNWTASTDNVGVVGYDVYSSNSKIGSSVNSTFDVTGLTPSTTYSYQVKAKDAAGNNSDFSNVINVKTLDQAPVNYCSASGNITTYEKIKNVKIGSINNTSNGTAGYENFTNISTSLSLGKSYPLSIEVGSSFALFKGFESFAVYIDFNRDGSFSNDERVFSKNGTLAWTVSGNVNVPQSAKLGTTRMRVVLQDGFSTPSACGSYSFGQVEDYTVDITGSNTINDLVTASQDVKIYPNPVKDVLNVNISNNADVQYQIFNAGGQIISSGKLRNGNVNVNNLVAGSYVISITTSGATTQHKFIKN